MKATSSPQPMHLPPEIQGEILGIPSVEAESRGSRLGNLLGHFRRSAEVQPGLYEALPHEGVATREREDHQVSMKNGMGYDSRAIGAAEGYLCRLLPTAQIEYLDKGSSAVIFEDKRAPVVYKVMREAGYYSYVEDEMAALHLLHKEGLAPEPYVLIDAHPSRQKEDTSRPPKTHFSDVPIVRKAGDGNYPVIVMEKISGVPLHDADLGDDTLTQEFDNILRVAKANELIFGDVEFVVDQADKHVKVIDVGGTSRYQEGTFGHVLQRDGTLKQDEIAGVKPSAGQLREMAIVDGVFSQFGSIDQNDLYEILFTMDNPTQVLHERLVAAFHHKKKKIEQYKTL